MIFQPTRPLRGATKENGIEVLGDTFQPTRPLRGATEAIQAATDAIKISTHAPLAGRDLRHLQHRGRHQRISTHAPLAGRDNILKLACFDAKEFQPTRPLRGAT